MGVVSRSALIVAGICGSSGNVTGGVWPGDVEGDLPDAPLTERFPFMFSDDILTGTVQQ
jgi:hypothetical protein